MWKAVSLRNAQVPIKVLTAHVRIYISFQYATGVNVVGMIPGTLAGTPNDRLFLIGAHYDTVRTTLYGTDDDGSGVVALLQVARQIAIGT